MRHERSQRVAEIVRMFDEHAEFWLAISPEGTRRKTDHWKTGFYQARYQTRADRAIRFKGK